MSVSSGQAPGEFVRVRVKSDATTEKGSSWAETMHDIILDTAFFKAKEALTRRISFQCRRRSLSSTILIYGPSCSNQT